MNRSLALLSSCLVVSALWAGCSGTGGGGSGGGSGSSGGDMTIMMPPSTMVSTTGQSCSSDAGVMLSAKEQQCVTDYTNCALTQCDSAYQTCLGANYKQGTFGGACQTFMTCAKTNQCDPCTNTTCSQCTLDDGCKNCIVNTVASCVTNKCLNPFLTCMGYGNLTMGGGCAALTTCCNSLTGTEKTDCQMAQTQSSGIDQACNALLNTYKTAGKCN